MSTNETQIILDLTVTQETYLTVTLYVPGGDVDRGTGNNSIFSVDNSQTQFTNNTGSHSHNVNGNTGAVVNHQGLVVILDQILQL